METLFQTPFFRPCAWHGEPGAFFKPGVPPMCARCVAHDMSRAKIIQIRRYMYRDVLLQEDAAKMTDVSGIQTYIVNNRKVVFIKPAIRDWNAQDGVNACLTCRKPLRNGLTHCSIACKGITKRPTRNLETRRKQKAPRRADFS